MEATSAPRPPALRIRKPRRLLSALSDERLVEHVRRGEPAAFEVLYDRYSAGILGFCRHMLGSASDAEDAAQQTFISAHADIQRHDRRELHVKAWLYTIARNRCLSMLRARREQPSDDAVEVATDDLLHDVQHRDDIRALLGDIAKLPDDQREALVLAEVGDLSHSDIGAILGCEATKVKSLVFQARTALIDRRTARETPCAEIREQLATLRGGALRRSHLRHHLEACPGCTQYRDEIRRQRAMLALALPVVPTAALRAKVFGGLGFSGSTAAAGGVATSAAGGGIGLAAPSGVAAKVAAVAVLAAGGAGGATVANHGAIPFVQHPAPAGNVLPASHSAGTAGSSVAHTGTTAAKVNQAANSKAHKAHPTTGSHRSARGSERGFTPVTGQSNGASARAFAQTRGQGKETSATHRHATAHTRARPVKPKHVATPRNNATKTEPLRTQEPKSNAQAPTGTTPAPETTTTTTPTPTVTEPATTPPTTNKGKAGLNGVAGAGATG